MIKYKVYDVVKDILTQMKSTRDSDYKLSFVYYRLVKPSFVENDITALFADWENGELPSMSSIGRARRLVQEEYPHLRGYKYKSRTKIATKKVKNTILDIKHSSVPDSL